MAIIAIAGALLLLAVGVYVWTMWGIVGPVIRNIAIQVRCAARGEKTPWEKRREEIEQLRAKLISREEAIARAREYAKSRRKTEEEMRTEPRNVELCFFEDKDRKEGEPLGRFSYFMSIGSTIPAPLLEMDAMDGTVLQWKTFPR